MSIAPLITFKAGICDLDVSDCHYSPDELTVISVYQTAMIQSGNLIYDPY
jgi:hypothetical protein